MARQRPLGRPPIKEALVDFRIVSDPPIQREQLEDLRSVLITDYPQMEERREFRAEVRFESGRLSPSSEDLGFHGLFFKSADGRRIAQFRRDGFTLNQLAPYSNAEELIQEALRLWELFRERSRPIAVSRIALRYLNALELPLRPSDDFSRFLTAAPTMPPSTPQGVSTFLTRVVAHEEPDVVIVTQKMDAGQGLAPFTMDIDAFRVGDQLPLESHELLSIFERLRKLKNRIFFGFLTEEAVELYQ